jgi:PAS domain S-box-containing protein
VPEASLDTYRAIFDKTPDAILIADDEARLIDANAAAEQLTGYSRAELLRMRVWDLAIVERRNDADSLWAIFLAAGTQSGPFDLQRKDGTRHRVLYRAATNVAPGAHMSMLRDLTPEEATYTDLQISEELLQAVFEHSPISLQVFAPDGRILRANRAWETLWDVDRSALTGYNVLHDEQLARRGVLERVRAAFEGETVVLPPIRYDPEESDHRGRARWLAATFVPVREGNGNVREVVLALEDQTERRRSETRASIQYAVSRILAESAGIDEAAPLLLRAMGETLEWAYGALWLFDSDEGALRCAHAWTAPDASARFARDMCRRFRPGQALPGDIFQSRQTRWIPDLSREPRFPGLAGAAAAGFRSAGGIPILVGSHALGALEFFTGGWTEFDDRLTDTLSGIGHQIGQYIERRAAEQAEAVAATTANHLKDEFLAVLSHELRTPLNAILGWSRMLRTADLDPVTRARGLEIIERNAHAQAQIVEDLLDVSRIITGKLRLDVREVDLAGLAQEMMESMRPAADAKGIQLSVEVPEPAALNADPHRLRQIVWNLLTNAIKFTSRGGRVSLSVRRHASGFELRVSDTGAGITPDLLPRVFDRFLQGDSSTTRQQGGLGLGLAIVRHLTELHGGTVSAESPGSGGGTTFRIWLPLSGQTGMDR